MDLFPHVIYITIPLTCVLIGLVAEKSSIRKRRAQWAEADREEYFKKLNQQSNKMDRLHQDEENDVVQKINELIEEGNKLKEELDSVCKSNGLGCNFKLSSNGNEDEKALRLELSNLKEKSNNLERLNREIDEICKRIDDCELDEAADRNHMLHKLGDKIVQLESENSTLSDQLQNNDSALPNVGRIYDDELLQHLDGHDDHLTLDFLKNAFTTLLDIKASKPDLDFNKFTREIKERAPNYITELTKLQVIKRQVEMRLESRRKEYSKELSSFSERRLEYILKNSGAQEDLDTLKDKNNLNQKYIEMLEDKLETKKSEVIQLQEMFLNAQEQSRMQEKETDDRYQAWKDMELRREKYGSERMSNRDQEINSFHHPYVMNSSSVLDSLAPPSLPIEIPPIEEILADLNDAQENPPFPYNSIPVFHPFLPDPPPPPVDLGYEDNLGQRSSANSIATSRHRHYA